MSENHKNPLVVAVDTETGGAGERQCMSHALLSIGAFVELPDGQARTFHQLVWPRPDLIIEPEALAVNGYSRTKWQDEKAEEERIAVIRFFAWLMETRSLLKVPKLTLVAHNVGHDRGFVEAAFERWQLLEEFQSVVSRRWRCSCSLLGSLQDAWVVPGGMGASLDALNALRLGGTLDGAKAARGVHRADDDAKACWLGYRWLLGKLHRGGAEGAENRGEGL